MRADNEFLIALIGKLTEIQDNCADVDTMHELGELIDAMTDSLR